MFSINNRLGNYKQYTTVIEMIKQVCSRKMDKIFEKNSKTQTMAIAKQLAHVLNLSVFYQ